MGQDNILKFVYHGPSIELISYLKIKYLQDYSLKAIKRAIDNKAVKIDQKIILKATTLLTNKCHVTFDLNKLLKIKIEVIYEDDDIYIINKPPFVTSSDDEIQKKISCPKAKLCHRLDKETSGVIVLAKNNQSLLYMEKLFKEHNVKKRYLALVKTNQDLPGKFLVKHPIAVKEKKDNKILMQIHPDGLDAETSFKIIDKRNNYYLIECFPKTGRTHQIRVHLSSIKAPIVGDLQYGGEISDCGRFLLHAESISFPHPKTGEWNVYSAKVPQDFQQAIQKLIKNESCDT